MVTQSMKTSDFENNFKFAIAVDLNNCLKRIKYFTINAHIFVSLDLV